MNIASTIASFALTTSNNTVHQTAAYNEVITHTVPHQINDYQLLTITSPMTFSGTLSCTPILNISSISCVTVNALQLKITYLAVPLSSIQISILNIVNYDIADISVDFTLQIYDGSNYLMEVYNNYGIAYT
jgi:hypothetical protein